MKENEKHERYFLLMICLAFLLISASSYYNFFLVNDYEVTRQIPCDPHTDSCFVSDCAANDLTCDQTKTYKKISAPSKYAGSDYDEFLCEKNLHCTVITCQTDTIEPGEKCYK